MALFDFIKKVFGTNNTAKKEPVHPPISHKELVHTKSGTPRFQKEIIHKDTQTAVQTTVTSKTEVKITKKTPIKKINATVLVIYQDEHKKALCSPQLISGRQGDLIQFKFYDFKNYDLVNMSGFTRSFVAPYGVIVLTYAKKIAGNIWLFCKDVDNFKALRDPEFITGTLDESYQLTSPTIPDYVLVRAKGPVSGTFKLQQQFVTYFYRNADWVEVDDVIKYIKILDFTTCYDNPNGNQVAVTLAKTTVWQTFGSVKLANDQWWHCLGGNLWVLENPKFTEISTPHFNNHTLTDLPNTPGQIKINQKAKIDYVPQKDLALYDKPFGARITTIPHDTKVTLTAYIENDGLNWFKVNEQGWTLQNYLKFTHH